MPRASGNDFLALSAFQSALTHIKVVRPRTPNYASRGCGCFFMYTGRSFDSRIAYTLVTKYFDADATPELVRAGPVGIGQLPTRQGAACMAAPALALDRSTASSAKLKGVSAGCAGSAPRVASPARRRAPAGVRARLLWFIRLSGFVSTPWQRWVLIDRTGEASPCLRPPRRGSGDSSSRPPRP